MNINKEQPLISYDNELACLIREFRTNGIVSLREFNYASINLCSKIDESRMIMDEQERLFSERCRKEKTHTKWVYTSNGPQLQSI